MTRAANTAVEAIDRLRDTMQSHERCSVVEVMAATRATSHCMSAWRPAQRRFWCRRRNSISSVTSSSASGLARLSGKTHFMIIVAEGVGSAVEIGKQIHEALGLDPRVTILGHIQRGGTPSARDRVMATNMAITP